MPTSPNLYSLCSLFIILSAKDLNKVTDEVEWHSGTVVELLLYNTRDQGSILTGCCPYTVYTFCL